jgi:hypothetical protein
MGAALERRPLMGPATHRRPHRPHALRRDLLAAVGAEPTTADIDDQTGTIRPCLHVWIPAPRYGTSAE